MSAATRARATSKPARTSNKSNADDSSRANRRTQAIETVNDRISTYPLASLAAGVTLGLAVGAILPRGRREQELLSGVGQKLNDAAETAVEAGRQQIDDMKQNAMAKVGEAVVAAVAGDSPSSER